MKYSCEPGMTETVTLRNPPDGFLGTYDTSTGCNRPMIPPGRPAALVTLLALALGACAPAPPPAPAAPPVPAPRESDEALVGQVRETERAFARTMADRDHAAFAAFLSTEAVFFSGEKPLRGAPAVAEAWKRFYEGPAAPFSWEPQDVVVLESGTLALSSGPVRDETGKVVATFTSIWRLEEPGKWRIVFDKGNDVCESAP